MDAINTHVPDSLDEIKKRLAMYEEENRQKQKKLEEERRQLMRLLPPILRMETTEHFFWELYAAALGIDLSDLEHICEKIKESPDMEDEKLFRLFEPYTSSK